VFTIIWSHTAEVGAKRLREAYFAFIFRQDIAFFDNVGAGEVVTTIETGTHAYLCSYCRSLGLLDRTRRCFRKGPNGNWFSRRFCYWFRPHLYSAVEFCTRHDLRHSYDVHHVRTREQIHHQVHAGISETRHKCKPSVVSAVLRQCRSRRRLGGFHGCCVGGK
jgi:hypothetical protein